MTELELSEGDPVISKLFLTTYGLHADGEYLSSHNLGGCGKTQILIVFLKANSNEIIGGHRFEISFCPYQDTPSCVP